MQRLTLRSGKDGRYLARIVDAGGSPFALDFGDKRIIDDARQRLLHGFTMWRHGELVNVGPGDPELLVHLAEFYASEGLLAAYDEPTWSGRGQTLDERLPAHPNDDASPALPLAPLPIDDLGSAELTSEETDLLELEDLTDLGDALEDTTSTDPKAVDPLEDSVTEVIPRSEET